MKTGRKPKPTALKRLHGTINVTRDRERGLEPLAPGALLDPPEYLSPAQAARFREILADAPANLLRRWDAPTLAGFVIAESAVIEANRARQADASPFALQPWRCGTLCRAQAPGPVSPSNEKLRRAPGVFAGGTRRHED